MSSQNKKNQLSNYGKYSGLALQMAIIIFVGVFGGYELDKVLNLKFPVFTVVLSLASVALAIYIVIRDLLK